MPRRARFALAGIPCQIIQGGNDRDGCFHRALFRAHLDESAVDEIRSATSGVYALGDSRVQEQIEAALGWRAIPGMSGRPPKALQEEHERQQALL